MEKYAIVKINGQQYKITEGSTLLVNRLPNKEGEEINPESVLLARDGEQIKIGTPNLDIHIKAKVVKHLKGDKIDVFKYKSKVRYRRHTGFRAFLTQVQVDQIGESKKSDHEEKKAAKTPSPAKEKVKTKTAKSKKKV